MEYLVGAATVAVGWSAYFVSFIQGCSGTTLPTTWVNAPFAFDNVSGEFYKTGDAFNLPAALIIILITIILVIGIKESARFNAVTVAIKLIIVFMFIFASIKYVQPDNWYPFIPQNNGTFGYF